MIKASPAGEGSDGWIAALQNYFFAAAICLLLTQYGNWYFFTGDDRWDAWIPPFTPGYHRNDQTHLGAEYINIATALLEGRGYSDPFGDPTGPTAWCPPLLVHLLAFGLWLTDGSREDLAVLFLTFAALSLALVLAALLRAGRTARARGLAFLAFLAVLAVNFRWLLQTTHDTPFQMLFVSLTVIGLWRRPTPPNRLGGVVGWGVLGGLAALAGPATGFCWAASTAVIWLSRSWLENRAVAGVRSVAVVAAVSIAVVAPWVAWQSQRLDMFVPIKSNAAFELWQGQSVLPDGVVVVESYDVHPYHRSVEGERYRAQGEVVYLREKKLQARQAILSDPGEYARKTLYRLAAATVWLRTERAQDEQRPIFWLYRALAVLPAAGFLALLAVGAPQAFRRRRQAMSDGAADAINGMPSHTAWALPAAVAYVAFLSPYVFVSYYERYGAAASMPRALLTLYFFLTLRSVFRRGDGARPAARTEAADVQTSIADLK